MTQHIAPYVLVGMEGLMLAGGVWLLVRALKSWRIERREETKPRIRQSAA